jgi:hypothetical protein
MDVRLRRIDFNLVYLKTLERSEYHNYSFFIIHWTFKMRG